MPRLREREAFLSGPNHVLDALSEHWERERDGDRLHLERFQPKLEAGAGEEGEGGAIVFATPRRTILRLAFPGGEPQPKPGPYRGGERTPASVERNGRPVGMAA